MIPMVGRMGGLGIVLLLAVLFLPRLCGGGIGTESGDQRGEVRGTDDPEREQVEFVSFVLDDAQQTWTRQLARRGVTYRPAELVIFNDQVDSGCGYGTAAVGPFYCPRDEKVYIDLSFYRALKQRFGAPGDFAQAYVIAHEIGHHVQHQLGLIEGGGAASNEASVRQELQADCLAGVWAHATNQRQLLETGDIEEALGAAAAIGDDTLQKRESGRVSPESWTHGSSAQRVSSFKRGLAEGDLNACDTTRTVGRR